MKVIDLTSDNLPSHDPNLSAFQPAKRRKLDVENVVIDLNDSQEEDFRVDRDIVKSRQRSEESLNDEDDIEIIKESQQAHRLAMSNPMHDSAARTSSSSSSSSSSSYTPRWGERTETDVKQVIAEDDDVDEETRALLLQVVAEEEEAREEELRNERLSLSLLKEERNEREKQLEYQRYSCCICLDDEVKLEDMVTLSCEPLAHRLCQDCFSGYCSSKIKDAEVGVDQLVCPMDKCKTPISVHEIKGSVPAEIFEKYERFQMSAFGKEHEDCRFCPKCNEWFAEVPQGDEDEVVWRKVVCGDEACRHAFCGRCGQEPHLGQRDIDVSCEAFAKWQKTNEAVDEEFETYKAKANIVQCPECNMGGALSSGCKFIYCRCGVRYCYLCQVKLEEKHHYSHFKGDGKGGSGNGPFGNACKGPDAPDLRAQTTAHVRSKPAHRDEAKAVAKAVQEPKHAKPVERVRRKRVKDKKR